MTRPVLLFTRVDPAQTGGVEAVFSGLIRRVAAEGRPVVELRTRPKPDTELCPLFTPDSPRFALHLPSVLRLSRVLARYRPAVVNVHFVTDVALYFVRLKRLFGYRLVLSAHGSDIRLPEEKSRRHLPRILRGADAVTVVSGEMRRRVVELSGLDEGGIVTVTNGIDNDFWSPGPPRRPGATLITAARLEHVKGLDLLLDAFAQLDVPEARLVIAGDGSQKDALQAQAERLGVAGRVAFPGFLGPKALRESYRGADLFVLPSRSEGFPIALLEAMATGLPFVAADVGGVGEIAVEAAGLCVPPEDPAALAKALRRMLTEGHLSEAGRAARARACEFPLSLAEDTYLRVLDGADA